MKLGLHVGTICKNSNLETALALCEENGYDVIELRLDMLRDYLTRHDIAALTHWFAQHRLKPHTLNPVPFFNFRNESEFAALCADFEQTCIFCKAIGCHVVNAVPSSGVGQYTTAEILENSVARLRMLASIGKRYDVALSIEFLGQPDASINTLGQAYDVAVATACDNVGVTLDCFHFHAMGSQIADIRRMSPDKLLTVHINDCEDYPLGQLKDTQRLWPGLGCINLDEIFGALNEIGYDGVVSVEEFRPEYYKLSAREAVETAKATMRSVLLRSFQI